MNEFGTLLRSLRKQHGLTGRALGKVSGLSHVSISRFENGRVFASRKSVYLICDGAGFAEDDCNRLFAALERDRKNGPVNASRPRWVAVRESLMLPPMSPAGELIDRICTERNWSIEELSRRTGIHRCTLSHIRRGQRPLSPAMSSRLDTFRES